MGFIVGLIMDLKKIPKESSEPASPKTSERTRNILGLSLKWLILLPLVTIVTLFFIFFCLF